jgi:hypothetical protein
MSLLSIVNNAFLELSGVANNYPSVYTSLDSSAALLMQLAQRTGDDVARRWGWKNLKVPGGITGDGKTTVWALPSDWASLGESSLLVSNLYPLLPLAGPIMPERLLLLKALPAMPIRPLWRMIGGNIEIWPALAAGELVTLEYRSSCWVLDVDGATRRPRWTADLNTSLIDESLIELGVIWRWKEAKGLQYAERFAEYERRFDATAGQEDTGRMVSMSNKGGTFDPSAFFPGLIADNSDAGSSGQFS